VRVCACAYVRVRACVCVRACARVCVCVWSQIGLGHVGVEIQLRGRGLIPLLMGDGTGSRRSVDPGRESCETAWVYTRVGP